MKSARLLVAILSLATLAACGTESITGPHSAAPAARPVHLPASTDSSSVQSIPGTGCQGTITVTTDSSGNTISTCTTNDGKGGYMGSGG